METQHQNDEPEGEIDWNPTPQWISPPGRQVRELFAPQTLAALPVNYGMR